MRLPPRTEELRVRFAALSRGLDAALSELVDGTPPEVALAQEVIAASGAFDELRGELMAAADKLGVVVSPIRTLDQLAALGEAIAGRRAVELRRRQERLARIAAVAATGEAALPGVAVALAALRQRAVGLRELHEAAFARDPLAATSLELDRAADDLEALVALSTGVIDDPEWDGLFQRARAVFGREVAVAAARRRIHFPPEPLPTPSGEAIAAMTKVDPAREPSAALATQTTLEMEAVQPPAPPDPSPSAFAVGLGQVGVHPPPKAD